MRSTSMHPVCRLFTLVSLLTLAMYHTSNHSGCHAALSNLTHPKKEGYSRLVEDIKAHPIARNKIPPKISKPLLDNTNDDEESLSIKVTLIPVDILSLDAAEQVLELSGYITLIWFDTDLSWNVSEYGGVQMVELFSSELWTPLISVMNGAEGSDLIVNSRVPVSLSQTGQVIFAFSVNLKTSCALNLMFFPFDEQLCEINLYLLPQSQIHLVPLGANVEKLLENFSAGGEWSLTDIQMETVKGIQYHENVNNTKVKLVLQRRTTFYLVSVVGPMALFTIMDSLVFLIPPESGEKVSFLISIFISNAVFSSFINGVMPRGLHTKIPLVMVYLLFMWVWSVIVFLATVFVLKRFYDQQTHANNIADKTAEPDLSEYNQCQKLSHTCMKKLGSFFTKPGCNILKNRSMAASSRVNPHNEAINPEQPVPGLKNFGEENENYSTSFVAGQVEDAKHEPKRLHLGNAKVNESVKQGYSAKTLDRIFLILSLLIIIVIDSMMVLLTVLVN
ncbi:hypothetical protein V1264_001630 [Littorina saxatilis]|uniref:Neurotransmitter-gated ion-channel ligand-binding domain-containing protein n=1 Tax=Littorina saxatilis TaxID=31220 RepID=A0AAN9C362_9CAEN